MIACTSWAMPAAILATGLCFVGGVCASSIADRIRHGKVPR